MSLHDFKDCKINMIVCAKKGKSFYYLSETTNKVFLISMQIVFLIMDFLKRQIHAISYPALKNER